MADYTLSAKGTYDGSSFNKGISGSSAALDGFAKKCGGIGSSIAGALSKVVGGVTKVTGVLAALGSGAAIKGGIDRALNIEHARFKLGQLGMDVESVMASASKAVDGTAFSLASAATSAALMGAAGVNAGESMTKALQASAGVAAMGGVEMERVSQVFAKVAAQGRLQGDELLQLSEMGVNATSALAKHMGKTQAEVSKMVSAGEVDFQTFADAMYATFGEAAYGANATFSGAMSNVGAAVSRVSAKFADPALQSLKGVFVALIPAINAVSAALEPAVAAFTGFVNMVGGRAVAGIEAFTESLTNTGSFISAFKSGMAATFDGTPIGAFIGKLNGFVSAVKAGTSPVALLKAYWEEFTGTISGKAAPLLEALKGKLGELPQPVQSLIGFLQEGGAKAIAFAAAFAVVLPAVAPIGAALVGLAAKAGGLFSIMAGAPSVFAGLTQVVAGLSPAFAGLHAAFTMAGGGLAGVKVALGTLISPVGLVVGVIAGLVAAFATLMATNEGFRNSVMQLVAQIGASLAPMLLSIGTMVSNLATTVLPLVTSMINMLLPVIGQLITLVLQVVAAIAPLVSTLVSTLMPILTVIIQTVVSLAAQILAAVLPVISAVLAAVQSAMPAIQTIFEVVMAAVLAVINAVWPVIQAVIETVMNVIQSVIQVVTGIIEGDWEAVWNGIGSVFSSIWEGIQNVLGAAVGAVQSLISGALGFISELWNSIWSGVSSFVSETWENVKSAVSSGVDGMMEFISSIPEEVMGFFSDAGSWLVDAGNSIIQGLADGIRNAVGAVTGAIDGVLGAVRNFLPFSPAKVGPFSGKGWTLYSGRSISEALGEGVAGRGKKAVQAVRRVMDDMSDAVFPKPEFAYAGAYGHVPSPAFDHEGVSRKTNYFGDIIINARELEDVGTINEFIQLLEEAKDANGTRV